MYLIISYCQRSSVPLTGLILSCQDLPDSQVCLVQLEKKDSLGSRGTQDLKANQVPKERLGPKVSKGYGWSGRKKRKMTMEAIGVI